MASALPLFSEPQSIVTIHVGSGAQKKTYHIYKEILCNASAFFDAAFNGSFVESDTQSMMLEDVDCTIFGLALHWMHSHTILFHPAPPSARHLASLWMLADRFLLPGLQHQALQALLALIRRASWHEIFELAHVIWVLKDDEVEGPNWPPILKKTLLEKVDNLPSKCIMLLKHFPEEMKEEIGMLRRKKIEAAWDEEPFITFARKRKWDASVDWDHNVDMGQEVVKSAAQDREEDPEEEGESNSDYGSGHEDSVHEHESGCFVEDGCLEKRRINIFWKSPNIQVRTSDGEFGFLGKKRRGDMGRRAAANREAEL